ncbi:hypothetical protein D3C77_675480 [compost metagenome]
MHLGMGDQPQQALGYLKRNHLVVAAMDDQGVMGQLAQRLLRQGQHLHAALARLGE